MDWIDRALLDPRNHSRSDKWFAWHPVRLGALGSGHWAFGRHLYRNRCCGVTIYQNIEHRYCQVVDDDTMCSSVVYHYRIMALRAKRGQVIKQFIEENRFVPYSDYLWLGNVI